MLLIVDVVGAVVIDGVSVVHTVYVASFWYVIDAREAIACVCVDH